MKRASFAELSAFAAGMWREYQWQLHKAELVRWKHLGTYNQRAFLVVLLKAHYRLRENEKRRSA